MPNRTDATELFNIEVDELARILAFIAPDRFGRSPCRRLVAEIALRPTMRWLIGIVSALAIITAAQAEGMPRAAEESFYKTQPEGLSYAVNARPGVRGQKNGRQMLLCYGAGSGGGPSDRITAVALPCVHFRSRWRR